MIRRPPRSTLFPDPPLFRSGDGGLDSGEVAVARVGVDRRDQVRREVDDLLEVLRRQVEQVAQPGRDALRSEEHTSELQSRQYLVCRLLLEKKKYTAVVILLF